MTLSKRQHAGMERELARSLTTACELAKYEIDGFQWLTHRVDYQRFPDSLIITWIFDSEQHSDAACNGPARQRVHALTHSALADIGISITDIARHVEFDSEQRCAATHGGDWLARLNSRPRPGNRHGKRH